MPFTKHNRIDSLEKLKELDFFLMDGDKPKFDFLAIDTETNGLLLYKSVVIGFSVAVSKDQGFYIPFLEWKKIPTSLKKRTIKGEVYECFMSGNYVDIWTGKEYPEFVTPEEYSPPQFIVDYMKKWLTSGNLILQNAPFDVNMIFVNTGLDIKDNVFCDVGLLHHTLDENSPHGLKKIAEQYKEELGINPYMAANIEQQELVKSIIENGGTSKEVWRAESWYQSKYACFEKNSALVSMEDGSAKFIEDVSTGDKVITHTGSIHEVYATKTQEVEDYIYNISLEGGRKIKNVTGEHPFLVLNEKTLKYEWVKVCDLKMNDLLTKPQIIIEDRTCLSEMDNDFWWFFGLYLAEGYVRIQNNNKYLVITLHQDEVPFFSNFLKERGIKCSIIKKAESKGRDVVICDTKLGELFLRLSGGNFKCYEKKISKEVFSYLLNNYDAAMSLIAGVYDGDGHFRKMKTRRFTYQLDLCVTSYNLINTIDLLFSKHEISAYRGDYNATENRRHRYNLLLTTNEATKLNLFLKIKKRNDIKGDCSFKRHVRILRIDKEWKKTQVHNISVDKDESYVVNGIITHNCADAFLTLGIFEVLMNKFYSEYGESKIDWFYTDEIMPLCKIVTMMKRNGVFIDVEHFKKLEIETKQMMLKLEDNIINNISPYLDDFTLGKSIDESISNQRLVKKIADLEGLSLPKDSKTGKDTMSKPAIKKAYQINPHWLFGFILGEEEIKYSDEKLKKIKQELYEEIEERRYSFNINSDAHVRWLFCEKLGMSAKDLPQTDSATKDNLIPSMKAEVLIEHMLPKFDFVKDLLTYNKLAKLYSSYVLPAIKLNINGYLTVDWRQSGTISGRFSCAGGFNLQTLPKVEEESNCCSKCQSEDVEMTSPIELLLTKTCKTCGHVEENIIQPSAIKKGFTAPKGWKIVNADFSSLEPRCVDPDSLVNIKDSGIKLFKDVKEGDLIETKYGFKTILKKWTSIKNNISIITKRGLVRCSNEHKIYVLNKGFIEAKDIVKGDIIEDCKFNIEHKDNIKLPLFPKKNPNAEKPIGYFNLDDDIYWVLGAFVGDGIWARTGRANYIGVCGLEEDGVITRFNEIMMRYGYKGGIYTDKRTQGMKALNFHDAWLVDIFKHTFNVIDEVKKTLRVPTFIFNSSLERKLNFIAGLIDTDGTYKKGGELCFSTKSILLATDIINLLDSIGLDGILCCADKKSVNKTHEGYIIRLTSISVNKLIDLDFQKFQIVERKKVKEKRKVIKTHRQSAEVIRILYGQEEELIDITVEGNEEFICNGMRVHNCFAFCSGDKKLKEVFLKGLDLYSQVFCDMFDNKHKYSANPKDDNYLKKINNPERTKIKPLVLGIPYGAKEAQVCHMLNLVEEDGKPMYEEGKLVIDLYLKAYPQLHRYMKERESECIEQGYVESLIGRRRHFEFAPYVSKKILGRSIIKDTKESIKMRKDLFEKFLSTAASRLEEATVKIQGTSIELREEDLKEISRKFKIDYAKIAEHGYWSFIKNLCKVEYNGSKNTPIQSLAAHIANRSMIEVETLLRENNVEGFISMQIHDEITMLVREDQAELAAKCLQQGMEKNKYAQMLDIPMIAEPVICDSLKESK